MISQEKALKIVRSFITHFEKTNIESQSGMLASANYVELLALRDLEAWIAAQPVAGEDAGDSESDGE